MTHCYDIPRSPWLQSLPADWESDRLKDIIPRIVGGGTPAITNPDFWDGDIVWVTPTDFSIADGRDEIAGSERKITNEGLQSCSAVLVPKGSVIMASRATIGAVRIAATELATNQGFISFVCDERVLHHRFLYYVIEGFLGDYFAEIAPRTTFAEISRGRAKQEAIGFPKDVDEQKLIASYLDTCCAAIDAVAPRRATRLGELSGSDAISRQINILAAYRKSVIHECVTGRRRVTEAEAAAVKARPKPAANSHEERIVHART